ncbi:unnamed protein product [Protopolystoma xenopodis]|uniref:Uncharacterized protein n=1 Tax=Protopolystoma xenopodis TaxID=117903 RepID=A0A3S5A4H5_9PLAT|nr:unnamed protein product [Protopolystoma xenopodis]
MDSGLAGFLPPLNLARIIAPQRLLGLPRPTSVPEVLRPSPNLLMQPLMTNRFVSSPLPSDTDPLTEDFHASVTPVYAQKCHLLLVKELLERHPVAEDRIRDLGVGQSHESMSASSVLKGGQAVE